MSTRADLAVSDLAASAYTIPTDQPEADGTFAWDSTTMVVVQARTDDPGLPVGVGWTYAPAAAARLVDDVLAPEVRGRSALDVGAAWEAMVRRVRNAGRQGLAGMAISAVDVALWDLKARLLDLPLHRLWGSQRAMVPVYGSGGFTTYDDETLRAQLSGWVEQGIPRVKIKIGESDGTRLDRDLARIAFARSAIGGDTELYVDANGGYTAKQALRAAEAFAGSNVTWFEEPVSSDDVEGLRRLREQLSLDVAAGEYAWDLDGARRLVESVDCLQIDATRCGGYTEWFRIAALAAAHGLEVSGHCAPALHLAVAAATPNLRHLEWFHDHVRIEHLAFEGAPVATGGGVSPADLPGHGLVLREPDLARYRVV